MVRRFRSLAVAASIARSLSAADPAQAEVIKLGFDRTARAVIGQTDWNIIVNWLAGAIGTHIPISGPDQYDISIVTFSSTATINIANSLVIDAAQDKLGHSRRWPHHCLQRRNHEFPRRVHKNAGRVGQQFNRHRVRQFRDGWRAESNPPNGQAERTL